METIRIRDDIELHMKELKDWLEEVRDCPPEEMAAFFTARLEGYEEHMAIWKPAYERFARLLPENCKEILDLGCGTGLELEEIWKLRSDVNVTGVDLNEEMLAVLAKKHPAGIGSLTLVCQSYFDYDMGKEKWDAVISFESLHHFFPEEKLGLYRNIYRGLKPGGIFLLGDYIACCEEEERILQEMYLEKRRRFAVPEGQFIHIDIPLTYAHETEVLRRAGFGEITALDSINGATILIAKKGEAMETKITICKKIREDKALRDSFNALAEETFGLNFEDWYQNGYWKDNYIPYCAVCDGEVAANVSVNPMEFIFDGEKRKVIQLGTVMTKPEYRMQGLSRRLMEEIEKDFGDVDGAFLFGNDSVREFYPRFGFVASEETQYVGTAASTEKEQKAAAVQVPMACKADWDKLARAVERSACQGRLHMWHNAGLILFYVSKFMQECVYWVESEQAYVIAEPEENTLMIHEVISEKQADLDAVISAFGGRFDRVVLGFAPECACASRRAAGREVGCGPEETVWQQVPRKEEDCTLFVKGRAFENFAEKKVMFPTLSHT